MSDSPYKIETINDADKIEQVLFMFENSFPSPLSERVGNLVDYARKLSKNAIVHIISSEDRVIGFCAYYCNDTVTKQAFGTLIAVADEYKGKNIGRTLVNLSFKTMKQKGMEKVIGEVDNTNYPSIRLLEKFGFTFAGKATDNSGFYQKIL